MTAHILDNVQCEFQITKAKRIYFVIEAWGNKSRIFFTYETSIENTYNYVLYIKTYLSLLLNFDMSEVFLMFSIKTFS